MKRAKYAFLIIMVFSIVSLKIVWAEDFPKRPVTLVVPWPAGGVTDVALRALAGATERHLRQPIIIENRPGGGGTTAIAQLSATARPDGYLFFQLPVSALRGTHVARMKFNPVEDLTFIIGLTGYEFGIVVRDDSSWQSIGDLIAVAKSSPGKLSYATSGVGTTPHLAMSEIARAYGVEWIHIPYKSGAETTNALLSGQVDFIADGAAWGEMVNAGRLRLLATLGEQRNENWPAVPTLRESGIDIATSAPYGLAGPKGIDPGIVRIIHDAFLRGMQDAAYLDALRRLGQKPFYMKGADYREFVVRHIAEEK